MFLFPFQLHDPVFLRSNNVTVLLNNLHNAKLKEMAGKALYEEIIEPTIEVDVPIPIKNMLW